MHVRVTVDDVYRKGANQFGVVVAEFTGADGALVQRQSVAHRLGDRNGQGNR